MGNARSSCRGPRDLGHSDCLAMVAAPAPCDRLRQRTALARTGAIANESPGAAPPSPYLVDRQARSPPRSRPGHSPVVKARTDFTSVRPGLADAGGHTDLAYLAQSAARHRVRC